MDILRQLKSKGLIGVNVKAEAFEPADDEQGQAAQAQQAQPDQAPPAQAPQEDPEEVMQDKEIKEKALELHKLSSELVGLIAGEEGESTESIEPMNEEVDIDSVIADLIDTGWSGDDSSQMRALELLKGIFTSDDPKAKKFVAKLDDLTSGMSKDDF